MNDDKFVKEFLQQLFSSNSETIDTRGFNPEDANKAFGSGQSRQPGTIVVPESVYELAGEETIWGQDDGRMICLVFPNVDFGSPKAGAVAKAFEGKVGKEAWIVIPADGMYRGMFCVEMPYEAFVSNFYPRPENPSFGL